MTPSISSASAIVYGGRSDDVASRTLRPPSATLSFTPSTILLEAAGEIAVLVDVADELVGEVHLAAVQVEQGDLVAQVVGEVARVDRDRLVVLALLVLLAASARVEAVEQDLLPVDLALLFLLGLGLRVLLFRAALALLLVLFLRLDHVEERIVEELLLEVVLEVEQGHVEQIHRLVEAWIDLELLLELGVLSEAGSHALSPCVSVGEPGAEARREGRAKVDARRRCRRTRARARCPRPSPVRRT